ncbi:MAG TPA: antitoxin Xre/MbcA/ParS toxin-binding domain-containing protein, partial [Polyangiaceae bacterium]
MRLPNAVSPKSAPKVVSRKTAVVSVAASTHSKTLKASRKLQGHARAHPAAPRDPAQISPFAFLEYEPGEGVAAFTAKVSKATPSQLMDVERRGVNGGLLKDLARELNLPASYFFKVLGVPKATAEQKASSGEVIAGAGGQAALGVVKLLGIAKEIVANSTATDAKGFDTAKWLGQWIERPQPSLGGKKPSEFLDTPTGVGVVARLLGGLE